MKKNIIKFTMFTLICLFALNSNVFAADITCNALGNAKIDASIVDLIHTIILVLQIAVPILLVVFGMLDLMKAVIAQKEHEIKKGQQTFIKRLVAAIIFFFVIAIVKFAISAISKDNGDIISCMNCFIEGSKSTSCQVATTTNNNSNTNKISKPTV